MKTIKFYKGRELRDQGSRGGREEGGGGAEMRDRHTHTVE